MALQIAIVGLPNVGKSTLFNALTKSHAAEAQNYPFCTIDPNVGVVEVPDERLDKLAEIVHPERVVPTIVEFVDVAGLVKGASEGEGLGNQFLAHIRQCHAIVQVIRLFEETDVTHVHNSVDPKRDREIIESELLLADLQTLEKRMHKSASESRSGDKEKKKYHEILETLNTQMQSGLLASQVGLAEDDITLIDDLHLITMKPMLYVVNMDESKVGSADVEKIRAKLEMPATATIVPISAEVEAQLIGFDDAEAKEFLNTLGIEETGLNRLIREAYSHLGLQTYFTAGVKEVRSWTIKKGDTAPKAAGVIHTDFEKGFIRAEVISYEDFVAYKGELGAKEKGKMRLEGKEYIVKDGDVMHFRFSN